MADTQFSVSWDAYQLNICKGLGALQQRGEFVDMTIAADGHHVKVHQMIMSLVSPYIKDLITSAQCPHPVIFLNKVTHPTLQSILEYAYTGEVVVRRDKLSEFLEACTALQIRGLENTINTAVTTSRNIYKEVQSTSDKIEEEDNSMQQDNTNATKSVTKIEEVDLDSFDRIDDTDHNDDEDIFKVGSRPQTKVKKQKGPVEKVSSSFQYSVSCQGNLQLLLNRYFYSLKHTRKNKERFWRCIYQQKLSCPATVATQGEKVLQRVCAHNHAFHDKEILKRVRNNNMFTALKKAEDAAGVVKKRKQLDIADFRPDKIQETEQETS